MTQENVEILRRAFPESAPANLEALFSLLDENVEWDYVGAFPEVQTAHSPAEVREFLGGWAEAFDDFGFHAEEVVDAGDSVAVLLRQWGPREAHRRRGRKPHLAALHLSRRKGGPLPRYDTKADALEAAAEHE